MGQQFGPSPSPRGSVFAVVTDPGWSWEATATIIQAVATIVALGGVAVTFFFSYRAERRERVRAQAEAARGREEAERADAAAERSERAAALSIDTMGRIAEAIEALAGRGLGAPSLVAPRSRVKWSLTHFDRGAYLLTNIGTATAHDVVVSSHPTLRLYDGERRGEGDITRAEMAEDQPLRFLAAASYGTRDTTITVTWTDEDDERQVWKYPLPPSRVV